MLTIELSKVDQTRVKGIYSVKGVPNKMPESACYLNPRAFESWKKSNFYETLIISDMLRTPESSLKAVKAGRGAKMPGFSGHNYGLSIDIDVISVMKNLGIKKKRELDELMATNGWFCHRTDSLLKSESWHYNYLGVGFVIGKARLNTANYIEAKIKDLYGENFTLSPEQIQENLKKLAMYGGDIDGKIGPRSKEAINIFQRAWSLPVTGVADKTTQRTLAFVTREIKII